jgi:signal recognition particle GTPase
MREVRRALIEADVALEVVKGFIDKVRERAVGQQVIRSVTPGQMVVKIVNDELVETAGRGRQTIDLQRAGAGADPDGRPAGLGQDDHHRQDRQAADRARQEARC